VDEVASRYPQIAKYQVVVRREKHKDEMIFRIELKEEVAQIEKLKEKIEQSIRDMVKIRGDVRFVPKGTIPEEARKIEDQRTWE
jgi:phenylacetate-CoA ligase